MSMSTAIAGASQRRGVAVASLSTITTRLGYNSNSNNNNNNYISIVNSSSNNNNYNQHRHRQFHNSTPVWNKDDYPDHIVVPFPALSPTMEFGTIAKWELSEGESFSAGSVIASIETDKATMDFEAQDDGILAKILIDVGADATDVPVGTPIAIVVEEPEDVAAFQDYVVDVVVSSEEEISIPAAEAPAAAASTAAAPVVGGASGTSLLLPSARFLAQSKYVTLR